MLDMLRRTVGFTVFGSLVWLCAAHNWLHGVFSSFGKVAAVFGLLIAVAVLLLAIVKHGPIQTIVAFLIGIGAYWWASNEFSTRTSLGLGASAVVVFVLWVLTVVDAHSVSEVVSRRSSS